jgi:dipeptidyl aminopeptidase/acylaminoacyl peptidase
LRRRKLASQIRHAFLNNISRILIVAQSDKLEMS